MSESVTWKSPSLNKFKGMRREAGNIVMTVDHVDRTIDPYLVGVIHNGVVVYSGLHATLADARSTCERKAKELK